MIGASRMTTGTVTGIVVTPSVALYVTESGAGRVAAVAMNVPVNTNVPSAAGGVAVPLTGAVKTV